MDAKPNARKVAARMSSKKARREQVSEVRESCCARLEQLQEIDELGAHILERYFRAILIFWVSAKMFDAHP
eukprot:2460099-Pleurochrysis_carterae.AAC.1